MYKSNAAQSSLLGLCVCVLVTVCRHTPASACILIFGRLGTCSGRDWVGRGSVSPCQWQVRLRAPRRKVTNVDIAQRKGNIALVSKRIKLVSEQE